MGSTTATPGLSDAELAEFLALIEGRRQRRAEADGAAVRPELERRRRSGWIRSTAQIRQVYFFDTPDLTLNQRGVVVRARRVQGKGGRLGREAAPGGPGRVCRRSCARSPNFGVEVDAMPGGFVCSGSMKRHARDGRRQGRRGGGAGRSASSSRRSSGRCTRRTPLTGSSWTTCRSSGRSSCSS